MSLSELPAAPHDYRDDVIALIESGRVVDAVTLAGEALAAEPDLPERARVYGVLLSHTGRLDEADPLLRRALAGLPDHPDFQFALGLNLLAQGRDAEGWPLYRARAHATQTGARLPTGLPFPRWDGEPLAGKRLLIVPEQGIGDYIQAVRFVPGLVAQGAAVTLLVPPTLERLFRENFASVAVLSAAGQVKLPPSDYWCAVLDLPGLSNIPLENVTPPYLTAHQKWGDPPSGFKIGLAIAGAPIHSNDAWRSLTPEEGDALAARLPGTVMALDPRFTGARDFADTASILAELDLIISVDTAAAHLAGAMNKPCLLMLPGYGTDWRWRRERTGTPWYPRHRLFRSTIERNWAPVINQVVAEAQRIADQPA